jgi:hypothetical protein
MVNKLKPLNPVKTVDRQVGEWWHCEWSDGTEQWSVYNKDVKSVLYVERVVKAHSKRRNWCVVNRSVSESDRILAAVLARFDTSLYPPKVLGPFKDLEGAKTALLLALATGEFT